MEECVLATRAPSLIDKMVQKYRTWKKRNEPCNLEKHARIELKAAGYDPNEQDGPDKWIQENVIELLRVFSKQGHSGFSAPYCVEMFQKLAKFQPLVPLQGTNEEWVEVSDGLYQNKRCSHVFKDSSGAYDINGIIWKDPDGYTYTSKESHVPVTFPYTPKREYRDRPVVQE